MNLILRRFCLVACLVALSLCSGTTTLAHPGAINLYVTPDTNQIYPFQPFQPAVMGFFAGIEISAQFPGFGVSFPANGVLVGEALELKTTLGLLYWDGQDVTQTPNTMTVFAPDFDNDGNLNDSPVLTYDVGQATNLSGMIWGTYSGSSFWEADSLYFLNPLDAAPGIYGLSVVFDSPSHEASDPFLFPFVYDPADAFDATQEAAGRLRLEQTVQADINFDGALNCQDIDLLVQDIVNQSHSSQLDLTGDALVTSDDLNVWLEVAGGHNQGRAYLAGDANLDGSIDGGDFLTWNANKFGPGSGWCHGDFNADGEVNGVDFIEWNANKFSSSSLLAVPEPGMNGLLLLIATIFVVQSAPRNYARGS
jgi:hypothetical protein